MKFTDEEREALIKRFDEGDFCTECGGIHHRACPRVMTYTVKYDNGNPQVVLERTITYFHPEIWEKGVIFRDDLFEEE